MISLVFATFPHALMILVTALSLTDARLYEAADALGHAARWRKFWTITRAGRQVRPHQRVRWWCSPTRSRDFGIPKVIGGNFNMLATDIFKLVIGQQDFSKGAVVGDHPAGAGGGDLRRRRLGAEAPVGAALGALGALRAAALARRSTGR